MSYAADLLKQATTLAILDPNRPNQANLRRSISSAYYAAFHLLIDAAARQFVRGSRGLEREAVRRAVTHDDMKHVCAAPKTWWPIEPVAPDLATVMRSFVVLQEARHAADYSLASPVTRAEALRLIAVTSELFEAWARVKDDPAARAFLVALVALRGFRRL